MIIGVLKRRVCRLPLFEKTFRAWAWYFPWLSQVNTLPETAPLWQEWSRCCRWDSSWYPVKRGEGQNVHARTAEHSERPEMCDFSHLVIAANGALSIQGSALRTKHKRFGFHTSRSVLITWSRWLFLSYLSASSPELPLKELELHLDSDSWAQKPKREKLCQNMISIKIFF